MLRAMTCWARPRVQRLIPLPFLAPFLILAWSWGWAASASAADRDELTQSLVKIYSTLRSPDFDAPWKFQKTVSQEYMGTLIEGGRILVTARAVGYSTMILMSRVGEAVKTPLHVEHVDYGANLAILKPEDPAVLQGMEPLSLASAELSPEDNVTIFGGGNRQRSVPVGGFVKDYGFRPSGTSSYVIPFYYVEVRQSSGLGWAEPVIKGGKLAAITAGQSGNTVFAIPARLIKHVLDDVASPPYQGFGRLGLSYTKLESPSLRQYVKAGSDNEGVLITEVSEQSPFQGQVQPGDILLKIGDVSVNNSGFVRRKKWGWVDLSDVVVDFFGGDEVSLELWRAGAPVTAKARLTRYWHIDDYVHHYRYADEPFVIFGGLVFQELSKGYLESWGNEWPQRAPIELLNVWENRNTARRNRGDKIIILGKVLADKYNQGFDKLSDLVVDTVNGRPVRSLAALREALRFPVTSPINPKGGPLAVFTFHWDDTRIILPYDTLNAANARVAKTYGVLTPEAFFQMAP